MATRILAAWYLTGQDQNYPETNFDAWYPNEPMALHINAQTNDTDELGSIPLSLLSHILPMVRYNLIIHVFRVGLHTK